MRLYAYGRVDAERPIAAVAPKGSGHTSARGYRTIGKFNRSEHVVIAEAALGKPLPEAAHVHHFNCDPSDNRHEYPHNNLVICQDQKYHKLLHKRAEALEACGHSDWLKCYFCHEYGAPESLFIREGTSTKVRRQYHRACAAADAAKRFRAKKLA